jgi:hypothetical protein
MKITRFATCLGKAHLVGDADHRHPLFGELDHGVEHLLDHLGVERRGRLVEQHDPRLHAQRAGDRHALLLTARELAGILQRLLGDLDLLEEMHRRFLGLLLGDLAHPDRGERAVLEDRQMREQVEVLEHHPDLGAHLVDVLQVRGQFGAVDDDLAGLVFLQPVDAADQRGLARPEGPQTTIRSPR